MRFTSLLRMILTVAIPFIVTAILVAQQPAERGTAEIGVMADFTKPSKTNLISLRIIGNTDVLKLQNIANLLGYKLGAQPIILGSTNGDPNIITDVGVGLDFQLPIMTQDGYLPIGPFAEACAPYVSKMNIVYIITGNYTYNGFENYQDADITYSVPKPETAKKSNTPIAFYRANVIIKKKDISAANIPRTVEEKQEKQDRQEKQNKPILLVVFLIILAVGAAAGIILARAAVKHRQKKL